MRPEHFPPDIRSRVIPEPGGRLIYSCLSCASEFDIAKLLYTCPDCGQVLLIQDERFERLKQTPAEQWRRIFDYRRMLTLPALKGIYRYHEFIGPVIPLPAVVYLGEGHTPVIEANALLQEAVGMRFYFKNDGQNPSASFKDRGMASALSYIHYLIISGKVSEVLAICASTGDTSAAAALYAAYLRPHIKSAVLLPHKKVTPQQLSQPLGSGARVYEIPGVFDDCMKVVEALSDHYDVALLNSKNAWRILGQESYSYEIAQEFEYEMADKVVVVPIGNAGNITAVMSGFIKFQQVGLIDALPKIIGVQSAHADPVYQYYLEPDAQKRKFVPQNVRASVAQAAMIGNPVSMPRVVQLVNRYNDLAGSQRVHIVQVAEQAIMEWYLKANRNGHIACTHGGECLAGLKAALSKGLLTGAETAIIDSTAHALKFAGFQDMYFENSFPVDFEVQPQPSLINRPVYVHPKDLDEVPAPGKPLSGPAFEQFVQTVTRWIAEDLHLIKKTTT
ncbi:MAG: threonine synthase [Desulfobacteraceae bacterium]|nr:MAG: threonine synthase [Desulfobacteraceae bacterium]